MHMCNDEYILVIQGLQEVPVLTVLQEPSCHHFLIYGTPNDIS